MKIRTRLILAFLLVSGAGFLQLTRGILEDLRPRYLAAMEETMVDTARTLAAIVETYPSVDGLRSAFAPSRRDDFAAVIYEMVKTKVNMRVYVTDAKGIVLFDSDGGKDEGKDYSRWNDVYRTLRGQYGARATRTDPDDPMTALLCVAAPIHRGGAIDGVLTVCKPTYSVAAFLRTARREMSITVLITAAAVALLGIAASLWITWPIERLTRYARAVRDGTRAPLPKFGAGEMATLGAAFAEMRDALEGKKYVENYVQALTHQMKSPLSAIRGAAELLDEDMPREDRVKFLGNLRAESARLQDIIDRMLELSALEGRRELTHLESVNLGTLAWDVAEEFTARRDRPCVVVVAPDTPVNLQGEAFLLRQALANLIQNALDFGGPDVEVSVVIEAGSGEACLRVLDNGPGIPEYARDKVFDRFYSLPRPDTGKKSSGLGLAFVREIAELHGGGVEIGNRVEGGVEAVLRLPLDRS